MAAPLKTLNGWRRLHRQRRADHQASSAAATQAEATRLAVHECRVRSAIGDVVGRGKAKEMSLVVCAGKHEPQFVIAEPIEPDFWKSLRHIEGLLCPLGVYP